MADEIILDKIRGSLVAGAVGDALGYPVEFRQYRDIVEFFGEDGITSYLPAKVEKKAIISDDTQMTLFTANGLLNCYTRNKIEVKNNTPENDIYKCYLDWLATQNSRRKKNTVSWLYDIKKLRVQRAPGITCLNALESGIMGSVAKPINSSKGCGGIMRVAPIGLFYDKNTPIEEIMRVAAEAAAITHGHSLGYIPSAAFAQIVHRVVYGGCSMGNTLEDIIRESNYLIERLYRGDGYLRYYLELINKAVEFSKNDRPDVENIEEIGGGWVAEDALAVAIYCVLKYRDNFDMAIISSVNHSGDSDSTGAITGNIVGALIGYNNISDKWKKDLELIDVILEIADDLATKYLDSDNWKKKYYIVKQ